MYRIHLNFQKSFPEFSLDVSVDTECSKLAFFGPSGSGKTTLLNCIAGTSTPDGGEIQVEDRILFDSDDNTNPAPEERRIGYMMQDAPLFPHMNVQENITYSGNIRTESDKGSEILEILEIGSLLDRSVDDLSGGERRRVVLARTLFCDPKLLLLDEPLVGLDRDLRSRILPYLREIADHLEAPLVLVTHRPEEVLALCDTVVPLKEGRTGSPLAPGSYFQETRSAGDSPFSIQNYFRGTVKTTSQQEDTLQIRTENGLTFLVPRRKQLLDSRGAVIEFDAGDPILGRNVSGKLSPRNRWKGTVREVYTTEEAKITGLDVSGERMWVRVTHETGRQLNIRKGQTLSIMLKVHALVVHPV